MENVRYNISPCTSEEVRAFISRINAAEYSPRNTVLADDRSHYDRYSYLRGDSKIAVVYDTTARVISITAPQNYADELLSVFAPGDKAVKRSTVPAQGTKANTNMTANAVAARKPDVTADLGATTRRRVFEKPKEPIRTAPTVIATAKGAEMYSDEICPPQRVVKRARPETSADTALNSRRPDHALDYTDEIAPPQVVRRNAGVKTNVEQPQSPANKQNNYSQPKPQQHVVPQAPVKVNGMRHSVKPTVNPSKQEHADMPISASHTPRQASGGVHRATISFGDDDYSPRTVRQTPSLRSGTGLYADISSANTQATESATLQSSTDQQQKRGRGRPPKNNAAAQSKESSAPAQVAPEDKRLKRRIPTAYEFLPQQAREDLSGGLKNFEQTKLTMTDYSGLLMQPYRGLEAFVLDLQRAEGIRVKMIGQAFDKDENGNYVLKSGYMQKIGSVVYGEVMVALYTEYYSRRNYFAHTDNSEDGSVPRSIPDRNIAKDMLDNMLKVIEYNAKKLKEIGFGKNRNDQNK